MANIWPTTKADGEVVPDEEWNGIVDLGMQKPSAAGLTPGRIMFAIGANTLSNDGQLFWDNTEKRLGVGTGSPVVGLHVETPGSASAEVAAILANPSTASSASVLARFRIDGGDRVEIRGLRQGVGSGGHFAVSTETTGGVLTEALRVDWNQDVGIGILLPTTNLHIGTASGSAAAITIDEESATPANPTADSQLRVYMRGDKFVIQFNNAGTIRYFTIDLTATASQQVAHSTTAP